MDAAGNVALTGCFDGVMNFGGGPLTSLGGDEFVGGDVFVAKLGADGAHRFSARYGDAAAQRGQSVAIDARGDLVVAGSSAAWWTSATARSRARGARTSSSRGSARPERYRSKILPGLSVLFGSRARLKALSSAISSGERV